MYTFNLPFPVAYYINKYQKIYDITDSELHENFSDKQLQDIKSGQKLDNNTIITLAEYFQTSTDLWKELDDKFQSNKKKLFLNNPNVDIDTYTKYMLKVAFY